MHYLYRVNHQQRNTVEPTKNQLEPTKNQLRQPLLIIKDNIK
jgi:hypothetical protein